VVYAAVFYLSLIWPRGAILAKVFLTGIYVVAIETFQPSPIPAQLSQSDSLVIRLFAYVVLGSRFSGYDLTHYKKDKAGQLQLCVVKIGDLK